MPKPMVIVELTDRIYTPTRFWQSRREGNEPGRDALGCGTHGLVKLSGSEGRPRQSMAWTNWPLFTVALVQRDYSDDDIRKIIGGNVLRVALGVFQG